ncbi:MULTISPECIES: hypothetical protein [unclassified Endozoicomonas]|uniref:hypothetical protein n=1 Tax=unclassified Endozoicomonas TaxID=2644528 RepID=UPI002149666A|nr:MULTISPECIES: hypothetical protein [unclassified Endozoicomonas]
MTSTTLKEIAQKLDSFFNGISLEEKCEEIKREFGAELSTMTTTAYKDVVFYYYTRNKFFLWLYAVPKSFLHIYFSEGFYTYIKEYYHSNYRSDRMEHVDEGYKPITEFFAEFEDDHPLTGKQEKAIEAVHEIYAPLLRWLEGYVLGPKEGDIVRPKKDKKPQTPSQTLLDEASESRPNIDRIVEALEKGADPFAREYGSYTTATHNLFKKLSAKELRTLKEPLKNSLIRKKLYGGNYSFSLHLFDNKNEEKSHLLTS